MIRLDFVFIGINGDNIHKRKKKEQQTIAIPTSDQINMTTQSLHTHTHTRWKNTQQRTKKTYTKFERICYAFIANINVVNCRRRASPYQGFCLLFRLRGNTYYIFVLLFFGERSHLLLVCVCFFIYLFHFIWLFCVRFSRKLMQCHMCRRYMCRIMLLCMLNIGYKRSYILSLNGLRIEPMVFRISSIHDDDSLPLHCLQSGRAVYHYNCRCVCCCRCFFAAVVVAVVVVWRREAFRLIWKNICIA